MSAQHRLLLKRSPVGVLMVVAATIGSPAFSAADWPEWRGPHKNGVQEGSPPLLKELPKTGLTPAWEVAFERPDAKRPSRASPVAAAGRAYFHVAPPAKEQPAGAKAAANFDDLLLCVELDSGKELWRAAQAGLKASNLNAPNTPCVNGGKVYWVDLAGTVRCADAVTGKEVWTAPFGKGASYSSSVTVVDGKAIVADSKLLALDAKTGAKVWENTAIKALHNSPVPWLHQGKTYLLAGNATQKDKTTWKVFCVDAADGKTLWEMPGGINSSPVVCGDRVATLFWEGGVRVYQLTPAAAGEIARLEAPSDDNQASTPVFDGQRVYGFESKMAFCFDVESKALAWKVEKLAAKVSSPILADGRILQLTGKELIMLDAATGASQGKAKVDSASCSSGALADGRLLVNADSHARCYDLRAK